jgi:hypothetical protein
MEDSSSSESSSSGGNRAASQESRSLDVNGISLIQIMDSMEDQITKMDGRLSALEDEETRSDLLSLFERVKGFMLLFQQKAITEITSQDRALKESRKREANWKDLSDLFSEYATHSRYRTELILFTIFYITFCISIMRFEISEPTPINGFMFILDTRIKLQKRWDH